MITTSIAELFIYGLFGVALSCLVFDFFTSKPQKHVGSSN